MTDAATEKEYSKVSTYIPSLYCRQYQKKGRNIDICHFSTHLCSSFAVWKAASWEVLLIIASFVPFLLVDSSNPPLRLLFSPLHTFKFEGGNGLKSFQAKQKNAAKLQPQKSAGGGKAGIAERTASSIGLCCTLCKTPFQSIKMKVQLRDHAAAKHPKNSLAECFPGVDV